MAGKCGQTYRIDPRVDPDPCNALTEGPAGLLVPDVELQAGPGLTVTAPVAGDCPQTWTIGADGAWAQTDTLTFNHPLAGADRVYEQVTGVPAVTIPRAGIWEISYRARGAVGMPANTPGSVYVTAALFKNGAHLVGSEAMLVGLSVSTMPNGMQATGAMGFLHPCAAGDVWTLHAYRIGQAGSASVVSNGDGRTRISAHWIGPLGDTPS